MKAAAFDMDVPFDERRVIVRHGDDGMEMVELPWGLKPLMPGGRPANLVRSEGRTFPSHRCLVPASEFRLVHRGRRYRFSLADGNWFYFAGIWRPASANWPEAYAILTVAANEDVAICQDRQMAVVRRPERMAWLDLARPGHELLQPLPKGSFRVDKVLAGQPVAHSVEAQSVDARRSA